MEILSPIVYPLIVKDFLNSLKEREKLVHELICKAKHIGIRKVESKAGNRYELVFDNKLKVKIPSDYFRFCNKKIKTVYLNY